MRPIHLSVSDKLLPLKALTESCYLLIYGTFVAFPQSGDNNVSIHIQVVDNDRTARLSTAQLLIIAGYDVKAYDSPRSALADLETGDWQFTLTDIESPGMDGFEFLREVKRRSPDTDVVLMTAAGFRKKKQKALDLGAYAFLEKPFDFGELEEVLQRRTETRARFQVEAVA